MVNVAASIRHPRYSTFIRDDIMLLRLASPIVFSESAQPIRFAPRGTEVPGSFQEEFSAIGWGYMRPGTALATVLQEAILTVVSQAECNSIHSGTGKIIFAALMDICNYDKFNFYYRLHNLP